MISLICTNCQTTLTIDDAFAGGVCRCQHCGTIQTVPSKQNGAVEGTDSSAGRSLYRTHSREPQTTLSGEPSNATLEQLADVVASSGLGGSGLAGSGLSSLRNRNKSVDSETRTGAVAAPKNRTPLLVALGAVLAVVIAVGVWLAMRPSPNPNQAGSPEAPAATPGAISPPSEVPVADGSPAAPFAGPQFCGVRLTGSSIVFLLDRGDSASEIFDSLKQATFASIATLSNERKFQVICWDNHTGDVSYPPTEPTFATADNLAACTKAMEDVTAFHQSDVIAPLKKAVGEAPEEIVMVTAKGFDLDESFASSVEAILKDTKIKVDTISLRGNECPALKTIAHESGGSYAVVSDSGLRAAGPTQ